MKLGLERDAEGWSAVGRDDEDEGSEQSVVEAMLNESNRSDNVLLLLMVAKQAATYALLAVEGWNKGFDDQAQFDRENADGFCRCVSTASSARALNKSDNGSTSAGE